MEIVNGVINATDAELHEALVNAIFPELQGLYEGPGAMTLKDISEAARCDYDRARERLATAIENGEMVEVKFPREDSMGRRRIFEGYVLKEVYDEWERNGR